MNILHTLQYDGATYRLFVGEEFTEDSPEYIIERFVPTLDKWEIATAMVMEEGALVHSLLNQPRIFQDGDQWCALLGENIQEGICGFGYTPEAAYAEFAKAWGGGQK